MRTADQIHKAYAEKVQAIPYQFCHYKKFDYNILRNIWSLNTRGVSYRESYNDVIIMADTETSKKKPDIYDSTAKQKYKTGENHVILHILTLSGEASVSPAHWTKRLSRRVSGNSWLFLTKNVKKQQYKRLIRTTS